LGNSAQILFYSLKASHTPVISVLGRLRQEDYHFEVSLGYIVRLCLKKTKQNKPTTNKKLPT
jgi:hypothetical protein